MCRCTLHSRSVCLSVCLSVVRVVGRPAGLIMHFPPSLCLSGCPSVVSVAVLSSIPRRTWSRCGACGSISVNGMAAFVGEPIGCLRVWHVYYMDGRESQVSSIVCRAYWSSLPASCLCRSACPNEHVPSCQSVTAGRLISLCVCVCVCSGQLVLPACLPGHCRFLTQSVSQSVSVSV